MAFISMDVAMSIEFVSKKPIKEPDWIFVNSTGLILPNKKKIYFDFIDTCGSMKKLEDRRYIFKFDKKEFNEDFFFKDETYEKEDLDWEQIAKSEFTEVHIMAYSASCKIRELSSNDFIITHISFTVWEEDNKFNSIVVELTQEQLDTLNANIERWYAK